MFPWLRSALYQRAFERIFEKMYYIFWGLNYRPCSRPTQRQKMVYKPKFMHLNSKYYTSNVETKRSHKNETMDANFFTTLGKNLEIYTNTYTLLRQCNNVGTLVWHFFGAGPERLRTLRSVKNESFFRFTYQNINGIEKSY